ncbi:hypothetical protein KFL_005840030 [Klebsormidium nitens]|uniref:Uncharacterized protein n=1 Tax=Klebsormidium nitens TaxID=105231 RepID=A0A1Y1IGI6_KLENI|nr:hypothetical protein KFL_005840030 [Klebsormidium nitens]|eukprot:GAQ89970.1 hypothetical protein KFL_005840030 [Klebsormidium nitens]
MQYSKHVSEGRTAFAPGASSQAPKKDEKTADARSKEPEIVVLNTAANVVKGWLEAEGGSDAEEDALPEPELRPPRLGLGAKYLPHAKVSSNMGTLEKRLRAKIDTSARQGSGEDAEADAASRKRKAEGKARDGSNGANVVEKIGDTDTDEDEEEGRGGRGGAFQKKQRGLPAFEVMQSKKAKKKKKKKREEVG